MNDAGLPDVPLDIYTYDHTGQVAWNRDSGTLWDRTRRCIRDRWDSTEFLVDGARDGQAAEARLYRTLATLVPHFS